MPSPLSLEPVDEAAQFSRRDSEFGCSMAACCARAMTMIHLRGATLKASPGPQGLLLAYLCNRLNSLEKRLQLLMDALSSTRAAAMCWYSFSEDQWNPSDDRDVLIIAVSPAFYRDSQRLAEFAL